MQEVGIHEQKAQQTTTPDYTIFSRGFTGRESENFPVHDCEK
jgi:hypothetical protein